MLKAVKKNVIVKLEDALKQTDIILLKGSIEPPTFGEIVAAGSEVVDAKVGDCVIFSQHAGFKYEIDSISYRTMSEDQIMCISSK